MTQLREPPGRRYTRTEFATTALLIVVAAMLLGVSPGLAVAVVAIAMYLVVNVIEMP